MIDPECPIIRTLVENGFKVSAHAYLRAGHVMHSFIAANPASGRTLRGWSASGDAEEAMDDLARKVRRARLMLSAPIEEFDDASA